MNDAKGDPASDPKIATHNSDGKKIKVTDTSNKYLQQKLLSNQNLPIITTTIDPRIDNRAATCGASPYELTTPQMVEVMTDATRSSAQIVQTPRRVSRIGRNGATPGNCNIYVSSPGLTSQF